jgi:hypothetical protein
VRGGEIRPVTEKILGGKLNRAKSTAVEIVPVEVLQPVNVVGDRQIRSHSKHLYDSLPAQPLHGPCSMNA